MDSMFKGNTEKTEMKNNKFQLHASSLSLTISNGGFIVSRSRLAAHHVCGLPANYYYPTRYARPSRPSRLFDGGVLFAGATGKRCGAKVGRFLFGGASGQPPTSDQLSQPPLSAPGLSLSTNEKHHLKRSISSKGVPCVRA